MDGLSRRRFLQWGLVASLALAAARPARAGGIADIGEAINRAGRLRMLSQRIAKAYCQVGQRIQAGKASRILDESVAMFADHLADLRAFAPSEEIHQTYADLDRAWQAYAKAVGEPPSPDGARWAAALSEGVLRLAHLGTTQLELQAGSPAGRLVNISGRQRMLSQRLAMFYMLKRWGVTAPEMDQEARVAHGEFASALAALARAPENTAAIRADLELVKVQWRYFDEALKLQGWGGENDYHAQDVATNSERILEAMDRVTAAYARLAGDAAPNP